jgi:hypothetical protein
MLLFDRRVKLTIAPPAPGLKVKMQSAIVIEQLKVKFKVVKNLRKEPNTGEITIWNLAPTTRAQLQAKGCRVWLSAGYAPAPGQPGTVSQIFQGDARFIQHTREGADWLTKIELGDAERAFKHSRANSSHKGGTTRASVLSKVAKSAGWDPGDLSLAVNYPELQDVLQNGYAAHGPTVKVIDDLLKPKGFTWSLQNGGLQILPLKGYMPAPAVQLDSDHGLIGSPAFGSSQTKGKAQTLQIKSLLQPGLDPGQRIYLVSAAFKGTLVIQKTTLTGDSEGSSDGKEWYAELEAVPV